jgi:hypothetical protein
VLQRGETAHNAIIVATIYTDAVAASTLTHPHGFIVVRAR